MFTGSGESGKSTIVKQMKIMYQNGFSQQELVTWRLTVYKTLIESAQAIIQARAKINLDWTYPENKVSVSITYFQIAVFFKQKKPKELALPENESGTVCSSNTQFPTNNTNNAYLSRNKLKRFSDTRLPTTRCSD